MNDQLTRALREKGDRFADQHVADLSLDSVLQRAGEIRRGRRMRATLVMATAVLAIAIPVGITVTGRGGADHPEPAPEPTGSPITLGDLPIGTKPAIGYASPYDGSSSIVHRRISKHEDKTYVVAGRMGDVAGAGPVLNQFAFLDGGLLTGTNDSGDETAHFYGDTDPKTELTWSMRGDFAVSPEGNVGAFALRNGTVMAVQDGGSRYFEVGRLPSGDSYSAIAVRGENCSGRSEAVGCTIYLTSNGERGTAEVWAVSPYRTPVVVHRQLQGLSDISSDNLYAGLFTSNDSSSCSQVEDAAGERVWNTCGHQLRTFSPDGRHLLATGDYGSGLGDTELAILDVPGHGKVVLDLKTADGATLYGDAVWEDDEHVLVTVVEDGKWAILRFGLDGSREYAIPPLISSFDYPAPFVLPSS
jgi:hypothetical protein